MVLVLVSEPRIPESTLVRRAQKGFTSNGQGGVVICLILTRPQ